MQRIRVEAQLWQQSDAEHGQRGKQHQEGPAVSAHDFVEWRRPAEADRGAFGARAEQADGRGEKGDSAQEGDQHPHPGNQPKLGDAAKFGRDESEKPRRRGRCRDQDLPADAPAGLGHGGAVVWVFPAHLAIADTELDREIDCDADKQDAEADRY